MGFEIVGGKLKRYLEEPDVVNITIPDGVASIGDAAFFYCTNLQTVTIPDTVVSIGSQAFFMCRNLQTVIIPNSVKSIGDNAFFYCENLQKVIIPDSVTSIGNCVFRGDISLQQLTISNSVKNIDAFAFSGCNSLKTVTIPDSVISIGKGAFENCFNLQTVKISDSVINIDDRAFTLCNSLKKILVSESNKKFKSLDGVLFDKTMTKLICYPAGKENISYAIPDSVISIGDNAFWWCERLVAITIPDSVAIIGDSAFESCRGLQKVIIPDSVVSIGNRAFCYCNSNLNIKICGGENSLNLLLDLLKKYPGYYYEIEGHYEDMNNDISDEDWKKLSATGKYKFSLAVLNTYNNKFIKVFKRVIKYIKRIKKKFLENELSTMRPKIFDLLAENKIFDNLEYDSLCGWAGDNIEIKKKLVDYYSIKDKNEKLF